MSEPATISLSLKKPEAPDFLTERVEERARDSILLTWDSSKYNADTYSLYLKEENRTAILADDIKEPKFVVTGLQVNQTYTFAVKSKNKFGIESTLGSDYSLTFKTRPDPPTDLSKILDS
jgi:hypothetical protein